MLCKADVSQILFKIVVFFIKQSSSVNKKKKHSKIKYKTKYFF
jgi:hypothetical protein